MHWSLLTQSGGPSAFQRDLLFGYLFRCTCEHLTHCVGKHELDLLSVLQAVRQLRIKGLEEPFDFLFFLHRGVVIRLVTANLILLVAISRV